MPLLVFAVFCEASPLHSTANISVSLRGHQQTQTVDLDLTASTLSGIPGFVSQKETDILDMHGSVRVGDSFGQRQPWQIVVKSSSTRSNYELFQHLVSDL